MLRLSGLIIIFTLIFFNNLTLLVQWEWQSPSPQRKTLLGTSFTHIFNCEPVREQGGGSGSINDIVFVSSTEGWAVGIGRTIFPTTNTGGTWTKLSLIGGGPVSFLSVSFSGSTGLITTAIGNILYSTDAGSNW